MKDDIEETVKMIFQAFNAHPAARWDNGRYVNPDGKENNHEQGDINKDCILKKYYELMNLVGIKNQIIRRMESLEHVMEAYPSSLTLSEVKERLIDIDMKYENLIRDFLGECLEYKEE